MQNPPDRTEDPKPTTPTSGRRGFLKQAGWAAAALMLAPGAALAASSAERAARGTIRPDTRPARVAVPRPVPGRTTAEKTLELMNPHTGESARSVYWANGRYVDSGLRRINWVLRDHRTDEVTEMAPGLLDLLYDIRGRLGTRSPFHVISGYRSPTTNAQLYFEGHGVAWNSMHIQGKAVDIRVPGVSLRNVQGAARAMQRGGVGYYPRSEFVHLDVGDVRYW